MSDADCICGHPGLTYDGPDPECPTHGVHDACAAYALQQCAAWLETLSSPTLTNDPHIRAVDWVANLVRGYAVGLR